MATEERRRKRRKVRGEIIRPPDPHRRLVIGEEVDNWRVRVPSQHQFDNVGFHGTKIIIYNLWLDDVGKMELDFESDPKGIRLGWERKSKAKYYFFKAKTENHIANRLRYSLHAYLSILNSKLPITFCIICRGEVVLYYNIATDLKHPQFQTYKPHLILIPASSGFWKFQKIGLFQQKEQSTSSTSCISSQLVVVATDLTSSADSGRTHHRKSLIGFSMQT